MCILTIALKLKKVIQCAPEEFGQSLHRQMVVASGRKPYFYSRINPSKAEERMEIDFLLSKTKTGRRKNIVPLEVKSAKRYTQVSLDKFRGKFRQYIDRPTVLDVNDRHAKDGVTYLPIYATPAFLEGI